ncbi:uncharacterized protein A1O9_11663 [Exophiala aquamarina CBS 119918]|uniref:Sugar phosphate phosphatase n=1 Tax=Exophiala aquamarina CBS 119918 TaxID=1182545 RepID=A0A072NYD5_9EURO|nr:uncharacterized protein A1O9_11663 [Exophiala aquamarina CBS 119918]KEF52422.1 hypothetical protein A1O9_11663 [Exophiala aquamarina CBS 119918]
MPSSTTPEIRQVWTSDPGTMANETAVMRWPRIIQNIVKDVTETVNQLLSYNEKIEGHKICLQLESLKKEITGNELLSPLPKHERLPYVTDWNSQLQELKGCSWLAAPWLFTECYQYKRVQVIFATAATPHWQSYDYFKRLKDSTFAQSRKAVEELAARFISIVVQEKSSLARAIEITTDNTTADNPQKLLFIEMTEISLWGNATDLSLLSHLNLEDLQSLQGRDSILKRRCNIVDDDLDEAWGFLTKTPRARIDIVLDNAGFEFFTDMLFATYLLELELASNIRLHVKDFPWFVSDVIPSDIPSLFSHLASAETFPNHRSQIDQLIKRMQKQMDSGAIEIKQHPFWTTGYTYHEMPSQAPDLYHDLSKTNRRDLVIFKGDLNYRKLTKDGLWPHTTTFEDALGPMGRDSGINILALRTNKADVVVGIKTATRVAELHKEAPGGAWTRNGKYAVISFNEGSSPS